MTAKAETKATPQWLEFLAWLWRRPRPTPFWRKRLDDMVEPAEPIEVEPVQDLDWMDGFTNAIFMLVGGALFISAVGFLAGSIFLSPGFLELGIADPLGRWYASFCLSTGQCDLGYLLAGTVVGLLVLVLAGLTMLAGWGSSMKPEPAPVILPNANTEVVEALGVLDERLVRFRADMVLNGMLPLSVEEQEQADEDDAIEVARGLPKFPSWLALLMMFGASLVMAVMLIGPSGWILGWSGAFAPLVGFVAVIAVPYVVTVTLLRYDQWTRLQVVEALTISEPPAPAAVVPALAPAVPAAYVRPELTYENKAQAAKLALKLTGNKSMGQIRTGVAGLICENQALILEVNQHRAARGLPPRPTHQEGN